MITEGWQPSELHGILGPPKPPRVLLRWSVLVSPGTLGTKVTLVSIKSCTLCLVIGWFVLGGLPELLRFGSFHKWFPKQPGGY